MTNPGTGIAVDRREYVLQRLRDVLNTLAPGAVFSDPLYGSTWSEILSDVRGRVFDRPRAPTQTDGTECPYVELLVPENDELTWHDDVTATAVLRVVVVGVDRAKDQGDGLATDLRWRLSRLGSELQAAVHTFPFWTGSLEGQNEPAVRFGAVTPTLKEQATVFSDVASGYVVQHWDVRYTFTRFYT